MLESQRSRNVLLYLGFVAVATIFWFFMALNDNIQSSFDVAIKLYNVPDSVTFITDAPASIHVNVRDKGTSLMRNGMLRHPKLHVDFREFASDGVLRFSPSDLYAAMRATFGPSAQISSMSIDSLRLLYTTNPGRRVPLTVVADVTAATGYVIAGRPRCSNASVLLYYNDPDADTITRVYTEKIRKRDLKASETVSVRIRPIAGVKVEPATVKVTIPVETLVKKRSTIPVKVINVPANQSLLIFPANVEVTYFVPLSRFNDPTPDITIVADYTNLPTTPGRSMPISVTAYPPVCTNVTLLTDSVEYTIIRQ